jgi:hypothetical protein
MLSAFRLSDFQTLDSFEIAIFVTVVCIREMEMMRPESRKKLNNNFLWFGACVF